MYARHRLLMLLFCAVIVLVLILGCGVSTPRTVEVPPTFIEGAAGSQYTSIPALLIVTHADSSQHNSVGCYTARRANPGVEGAPPDGWSLSDARVSVTGFNDAAQLAQACATP